jgi:hypothetical protein
MAEPAQSFQSHTRWFPPFHFVVLPILFANFLYQGYHLFEAPSFYTAWGLLLAFALLGLAALTRQMVISVQDRVIRVEERLRLHRLVAADLQPKIDSLTRGQLIAIRFASDAEVEGLVRDIVAGKYTTQKDIKGAVKNWRPDYLRA